MIYRLEQTERLPLRKHVIKNKRDGAAIYAAHVPGVFRSSVTIDGAVFETVTETISKTVVIKNGMIAGEITPVFVKTGKFLFLPIGYDGYRLKTENEEIEIFDIGLGADHHYIVLLSEGKTVAVIHKDDKVVNYLNTYTIYAEDKEHMDKAIIVAMFFESTAYCDRTAGIGYSVVDSPYYSSQKELRAKYDPTFIERVKAME